MRFLFSLFLLALPVHAAPTVATDIAPVHSIVAAMMEGVAAPGLILPATADPHHHALRPSQARMLAEADLVIWIGPALTPWMDTALDSLAAKTPRLTLVASDHDHEAEHDHDDNDAHQWLDPVAVLNWLPQITAALTDIDPDNAAIYAVNQTRLSSTLATLNTDLGIVLAPIKDRPFVTAHNALGPLEHRFDLTHAGSISDTDANRPGAGHLRNLRQTIIDTPVSCLLIEPSTNRSTLRPITDGVPLRTVEIDLLGQNQPSGPALYPTLMLTLADAITTCLR